MTQLYTHPDYDLKREDWNFCREMYEGKKRILTNSTYLIPHNIELNQNDPVAKRLRAQREQNTEYLNNSNILNSIWVSLLFRKPMEFDAAAQKLLEDIGENVDGTGKGFEQFYKNVVTPIYLNYGKVAVLCDSYDIKPRNLKEQQELKARAYLEAIEPLNMPDWDIETEDTKRIGAYNWLRYEYFRLKKRTATSEPKLERVSDVLSFEGEIYTVTRYVQIADVPKEQKDQPPVKAGDWKQENTFQINGLTEIPISHIDDESWLLDANRESKRYHNIRSNRDNILHQQGYSQSFIIGLKDPSVEQIKAMSEYTWPLLPAGCSVQTVAPTDTSAYERAMEESLMNVYKVGLNQLRSLPANSKENMSFDSMMQEKDNTMALYEAAVVDIEKMAQKSLEQLALMNGVKNFKGKVSMYRDANPMSWDQFIQIFQSARDVFRQYPELEKMATKRLVSFMGFSDEEQTDALDIVENGPDKAAIDKQQTEQDPVAAALNGK